MNYSSLSLLLVVLVCLGGGGVRAWGGLFNRFNPSMLSNLGYGGSYGKELYEARSNPIQMESSVVNESDESDDPCIGKTCTANEHCCDGHVCVDTEEDGQSDAFGTCLPIYGKKQGESCFKDNDCESGFLCLKGDIAGDKSCQAPVPGAQGLGDDCRTSSDCNIHKGLCCKLQRRARSQPKKICTYFTDPLMCVGPVNGKHIRSAGFEHTAGEKRMSGHPDYHHFRK